MDRSLLVASTMALLASCGAPGPATNGTAVPSDTLSADRTHPPLEELSVIAPENARLRVVEAPPSTSAFSGASIAVRMEPVAGKDEARFDFSMAGFDLKAQTPDAPERGCANSPDGQHIHFILNNAPYLAKYEASFTEKVKPGRNVLLAFLSRSYHESVKQPAAFVLKEFTMPGEGGVEGGDFSSDPTLFYSRPKGEYKKSDGDKVLLDFYVLNDGLSSSGYHVRATIDGQAFTLTKWAPYFIEGLELGDHTVRLELIDARGLPVPGPFNDSGERSFKLLEG